VNLGIDADSDCMNLKSKLGWLNDLTCAKFSNQQTVRHQIMQHDLLAKTLIGPAEAIEARVQPFYFR